MGWRERAAAKLSKAVDKYLNSKDPKERKEGSKRIMSSFDEIIRTAVAFETSLFKQKALSGIYEKQLTEGVARVNRLAVLLASSRGNDPENRFVLKGGIEAGQWARRIQRLLDLRERSCFGDVSWDTTYPLRRPVWKRWIQILGEHLVRLGYGKEKPCQEGR